MNLLIIFTIGLTTFLAPTSEASSKSLGLRLCSIYKSHFDPKIDEVPKLTLNNNLTYAETVKVGFYNYVRDNLLKVRASKRGSKAAKEVKKYLHKVRGKKDTYHLLEVLLAISNPKIYESCKIKSQLLYYQLYNDYFFNQIVNKNNKDFDSPYDVNLFDSKNGSAKAKTFMDYYNDLLKKQGLKNVSDENDIKNLKILKNKQSLANKIKIDTKIMILEMGVISFGNLSRHDQLRIKRILSSQGK